MDGVIAEGYFDAVGCEGAGVLVEEAAFAFEEDVLEVANGEWVAGDADGEAANEFRFESELDEVGGGSEVELIWADGFADALGKEGVEA